ncbi:PREDICTED: transmembrane and TPR repeat-containing protein 1-like [Nicrophorus vespilloides]|uniref:dolichyl-phosphate-mannose--protein mannosyltransferase n=1 Tax=Nicrophorus vespilloides TaxID=110193 RepID=A0ABM1M4K6_NICVS|nr:PREDICTED: transmembrane and TPR repeat-containing protein 1-like [Nicrophorus vespilloides]XP_017769507.1 PREDICTED: transmembrane and TPR repeat-containing protein 1-like [Nicrophorus vespilloides]
MRRRGVGAVAAAAASEASSKRTNSPSSWPIYSLVSTVAVASYLNGLNGDFVHDDIPAVTMNKDVLAINPISHVFKNDFWGTPMADVASHKSYRPLTVLTFRANYLCFGMEPLGFHMTNVLLHAISCLLFTRVCLSVANLKPPFATLAGLLFAIHPIHTEAVTGIVGRADVLASVFFLISLLAYHGMDGQKHGLWISVVFGGLSMLAKETGITVFVLNLAYDIYKSWPSLKKTMFEVRWSKETQQFANRAAKVLTSLGLLLAVRLALLQGSLPKFSQQDNPAAFHPSLSVRILTFCYLAAFNWWLLLCPATLSHDWQMGSVPLVTSIWDTRNLVTCLFFAIALALAIKSLMDYENPKNVPVVLGLLLLVLPFLPATNLLVTVGFVVAERVLYIPSMGCILLVVYGMNTMWGCCSRHRQTVTCFVILMLTASCLRVVIRNRDWRSRESLLRAGIMTLPHNAKMHYNFGNFLRDSSRPELARTHYFTALRLWPTYASAHNNLGTLIGDEEEAEKHFLLAIRYSVDHVNAHYNLGQLYRKSNRSADSERMLRRCLKIEPHFTPAYIELARLKGSRDRSVGALLRRTVQLNPHNPHYITLYAQWLLEKGNARLSLKYYWRSLSVSPTYLEGVMGATRILRKFGDHARLFQLITRYQCMLRLRRGQMPLSPHIYLQGWHLKSELTNKAKAYDNCQNRYGDKCVKTKTNNFPAEQPKWSAKLKLNNKTKVGSVRSEGVNKQCSKAGDRKIKHRPSTPIMVHHILDTV